MFLFGRKGPAVALEPGDEIEFDILGAEHREIYITEVLEIDKKAINLIIPQKGEGKTAEFEPGMKAHVQYELEEQLGSFQTEILEVDEAAAPPMLKLAQPKKVEWKEKTGHEIQRRNFVRLQEALTIRFSPMRGIFREGTSMDISGNGLSMVVDLQLEVGKVVTLTIPLPEKVIGCAAKVVRCVPYSRGGKNKFEVGLKFENIEPSHQDMIVRHIFERQRDLRRRGLL